MVGGPQRFYAFKCARWVRRRLIRRLLKQTHIFEEHSAATRPGNSHRFERFRQVPCRCRCSGSAQLLGGANDNPTDAGPGRDGKRRDDEHEGQ